ncbi:hypothetical protein F0P96_11480 [Hymenobacter busanensis]|uniref:Uncharacterized protein n=1 Tax=Hymenobacter busanensis TaxID=2607656 RepID=A0A7L4ZVR1_9BACT|nr:hypothetical protein [Hymenobacter busanensis]KAA9332102.1 hypothetical protein F0P96_11480 [Hymenobacter busanensis]QHJ07559.1 hypothetical protein GUY19_09790 [Hymenobacter busanensis]
MKKMFLLLSCAAAMTMASCSQDKSTDTAADGTVTTTTTTTTTATPAMYTEEAYNRRADRIAADMATKMKLDEATRAKVRTAYYNRSKRLGELHNQYMEDTTGMAAAMRTVYADTDTEMKTIFTDPTQYSAYESSRTDYYEDRYMDDTDMASGMGADSMSGTSSDMSSSDMSASASSSGTDMSVSKMKAKDGDGNKIKVKSDGDIKTKDAAGNKGKVDADDGTMKEKTEAGKTKM